MPKFCTVFATAVVSALSVGFLGTPAHADEQIVSVFDGNYASERNLAGYSAQTSVILDEAVTLRVRSQNPWTVSVIRLGSYVGGNGKVLFRSAEQPPISQPDCTLASKSRMIECPWQNSITLDAASWQPGLYVARMESIDGYAIAPFTVRSSSTAGTSVMVTSMMSLAAYNQFGAYNAYKGATSSDPLKSTVTSLDRPLDAWGLQTFRQFEVPVAEAVDRNLPNASWTTDIDIHSGATSLAGARSIITSGHAEYWSLPLRANVENALASGTNLFVTGANSIFWRVRMQASATGANRQVVIYKSAKADPKKKSAETTARWRDTPKANPESKITGTLYNHGYEACKDQVFDWVVNDPSWWGYANTGVTAGSRITGLVGREFDQISAEFSIPKATQIVAHTKNKCTTSGKTKKKSHDATYITNKSGGGVFAVGTQLWPCAMNGACTWPGTNEITNAFTKQVTDNVIQRFDQGPVGLSAPSVNNVKQVYKKKIKYVNPKNS